MDKLTTAKRIKHLTDLVGRMWNRMEELHKAPSVREEAWERYERDLPMTTAQVAAVLGTTSNAVLNLVYKGKLKRKSPERMGYTRADVRAYLGREVGNEMDLGTARGHRSVASLVRRTSQASRGAGGPSGCGDAVGQGAQELEEDRCNREG